jgi:hypothetical protein
MIDLYKIKYLPFLIIIFLLSCSSGKIKSDNTIENIFNGIDKTPSVIKYHNSLEINNKGGHLQGVQIINRNNINYAVLSGSSDSYSYYSVVKLGEENSVISVNRLMDKPFKHAGGFQIFRNYLAVGIEDNSEKDKSKVCIYDISDPENPSLQPITVIEREGEVLRSTAGCVGITGYKDNVLIAVGDWDTKHIDFYSCSFDNINNKENSFEKIFSIDTEKISREGWIDNSWLSYQNINLFTDKNDKLYLIGFGQNSKKKNIADLFNIEPVSSDSLTLTKIASKAFDCTDRVSFRAGAGVEITDSNEIRIISCDSHIRSTSTLNYFRIP